MTRPRRPARGGGGGGDDVRAMQAIVTVWEAIHAAIAALGAALAPGDPPGRAAPPGAVPAWTSAVLAVASAAPRACRALHRGGART